MELIAWEDWLKNRGGAPVAVTIGVFDGVHRGHQSLLKAVTAHCESSAGAAAYPAVITFTRNPKRLLNPAAYEGDLCSLERRLTIFEEFGIKRVILIDFSENFSRIDGRDFVDFIFSDSAEDAAIFDQQGRERRIVQKPLVSYAVLGENFHCGYRHGVDAAEFKRLAEGYGAAVRVIPILKTRDGQNISSSLIRQAVRDGNTALAEACLGRKWESGAFLR